MPYAPSSLHLGEPNKFVSVELGWCALGRRERSAEARPETGRMAFLRAPVEPPPRS